MCPSLSVPKLSSRSLLTSLALSPACFHLASPTNHHLLGCHPRHPPGPASPHCPDRKGGIESRSGRHLPGWGRAGQARLPAPAGPRGGVLRRPLPMSLFCFLPVPQRHHAFILSVSTGVASSPPRRGQASRRRQTEPLRSRTEVSVGAGVCASGSRTRPSLRCRGRVAGAEPIVARDDRAQPIRAREAWRTRGGAGRVRARPLAARRPTPSPGACASRAGSQTRGTGRLESGESAPSRPAHFFTGRGLDGRVGACRGRILTRAVSPSGDCADGWGRVRSLP